MTEQEYQKYSKAQRNYLSARYEILLIIVMTIVNMFLLPTTETYYVCSISFATFQIISAILAKKDPSQFGVSAELAEKALPGAITIAIIITAVYVLFFFLSKKRRGCLITLLVLVSIDTFFTLLNSALVSSAILDIVVHGVAIFFLAKGVSSGKVLQDHFAKGVAVSAAEIRGYFEESQRQKAEEAVNRARTPQFKDDDPFGYGMPSANSTAAKPQANVVTRCPSCGAPRNGSDKFCPYCGTAYEAARQDSRQTTVQTPSVTTNQSTTPSASDKDSGDNDDLA